MKDRNWFITVRDRRIGFQSSRVCLLTTGEPYLDRFILYLGGPCLRLHRFWRGDDDRAVHDHPWTFWTFPLTDYVEVYWAPRAQHMRKRIVMRWKWHKREAEFRHFVIGRADGKKKPFWTIVIATEVKRDWGFWPEPRKFIYWKEWL